MELSYGFNGVSIILVGISSYDDPKIDDLPTVSNNLRQLRSIFQEEDIVGLDESCIYVLEDIKQPSKLSVEINKIAKETHDTLIIYYAGHGKVGSEGDLLLTVQETISDSVDYSSLTFGTIRKIVSNSPASKKIVILDCCFSGRAINYMGAEEDLLKSTEITGTYVLTAVPENTLANSEDGSGQYTAFSGTIIKILKNGITTLDKIFTLDDIYNNLHSSNHRSLRSKSNGIELFKFAYNRARKSLIRFRLEDGHLESTPNATMSRMTMQKLRIFEKKNGIHQQRFVLISKLYMNHLGLTEGDWADITVEFPNGKVTREKTAIFSKPASDYYSEYSTYFTLAMRNLLEVNEKDDEASDSVYKISDKIIRIYPANLKPVARIEYNSSEFICRIPITDQIKNHKKDKPFIAMRALEFELLGVNPLDVVDVSCVKNDGTVVYFKKMYIVILKDNPGRAVCGISKYELDLIFSSASEFRLIIEIQGKKHD